MSSTVETIKNALSPSHKVAQPQKNGDAATATSATLPTQQDLSGTDGDGVSLALNELNVIHGVQGQDLKLAPGGRKILVAWERSPAGEVALDYALSSCKPSDHVFIVSVLPASLIDRAWSTAAPYLDIKVETEALHKMSADLNQAIKEKAALFERQGVSATTHTAHGNPKIALVHLAKFHHVDEIILGRRNLTGLQKVFSTASVSQWVVNHADVNVIVAKQ